MSSSFSSANAEYQAIEAAVMETARGRAFLAEYARRRRQAGTTVVLAAIARSLGMAGKRSAKPHGRRADLVEHSRSVTERSKTAVPPTAVNTIEPDSQVAPDRTSGEPAVSFSELAVLANIAGALEAFPTLRADLARVMGRGQGPRSGCAATTRPAVPGGVAEAEMARPIAGSHRAPLGWKVR